LNLNPSARQEAEGLRRAWELLDYLPRPEPSPTFSSKTLERISVFRPAASRGLRSEWKPWAYGLGWAAAILLAGTIGFGTVDFFMRRTRPPQRADIIQPADLDAQLIRDLRVIDNQRLYEHVGDIHFLRELADPDLFGDS